MKLPSSAHMILLILIGTMTPAQGMMRRAFRLMTATTSRSQVLTQRTFVTQTRPLGTPLLSGQRTVLRPRVSANLFPVRPIISSCSLKRNVSDTEPQFSEQEITTFRDRYNKAMEKFLYEVATMTPEQLTEHKESLIKNTAMEGCERLGKIRLITDIITQAKYAQKKDFLKTYDAREQLQRRCQEVMNLDSDNIVSWLTFYANNKAKACSAPRLALSE